MTVKEYITSKMSTFGVNISDVDLLAMLLPYSLDESTEVDSDNMNVCNMAMTEYIPTLMLRATSVSESGFSMSWDMDAIRDYYYMMCKKYGIDDTLSDKPRIEIY